MRKKRKLLWSSDIYSEAVPFIISAVQACCQDLEFLVDFRVQTQSTSAGINHITAEDFCWNIILSALSDHLYDVYHATKSVKELWNLLRFEYGIDDAGLEPFKASTFNKFVMVEGKAISDQIHEFQDLLRAFEENGSNFSEDYEVFCLIDKFLPLGATLLKEP
ncbi:hypothetical protein RJ639_007434 [Escallonia herrerae]|uniref:Uncharacterized protein n=1 Tax=Escallonia herrerae TaxID=1293975 RepID=A0AA89AVI1_9ASTE|nr:hypothetical protein RJ639_007434 [Escallonia herrerae]